LVTQKILWEKWYQKEIISMTADEPMKEDTILYEVAFLRERIQKIESNWG